MKRHFVLWLVIIALTVGVTHSATAQPKGDVVYALPVTIAPSWFDPAEAPPQITPYVILYALHDALVRPLPGVRMGSALAEAWSESPDGLTYEFKLRPGLKFHNGDPCTAEDVRFSFARYKGPGAKEYQTKVKSLEVVDERTVRFHLPARPLAGFYDLLWQLGDRCRSRGPQEIHRASRR